MQHRPPSRVILDQTHGKAPMPHPIHIGVGGWTYAPWRGAFFPPGLKQADELAFASRARTVSSSTSGAFLGGAHDAVSATLCPVAADNCAAWPIATAHQPSRSVTSGLRKPITTSAKPRC